MNIELGRNTVEGKRGSDFITYKERMTKLKEESDQGDRSLILREKRSITSVVFSRIPSDSSCPV